MYLPIPYFSSVPQLQDTCTREDPTFKLQRALHVPDVCSSLMIAMCADLELLLPACLQETWEVCRHRRPRDEQDG